MESGTSSKPLKIVWLCHFANKEFKEHFKTPHIKEFAPWITNTLAVFQNNTEVDLHVVSPNVFTNQDCCIKKNGVTYHFYKVTPMFLRNRLLKKAYNVLDLNSRTNFWWVKRKIATTIRNIQPDLIHLHGAENPYYSIGILPLIESYPSLTTIQGFARNASFDNFKLRKKIEIEEKILKKVKHIGTRTKEMSEIALQINPNAILHFHNYTAETPSVMKNNIEGNEPIDCLFFARICKDKGIEDLLSAISIAKKQIPDISLSVIGSSSVNYLEYLKKLCLDLKIENNVKFLGFFPTQDDIFQYAINAKMCVLPTYHDVIPGTIIESMLIKLPVVAYAVGGIPELNRSKETIVLVEKHNINQLAEKILQLIKNSVLRKTLSEDAYVHVNQLLDKNKLATDLLNAYKSILSENSI
ncbi:MAG: glycosyltransferase family 4 protein [Bacteroidota bacterium]